MIDAQLKMLLNRYFHKKGIYPTKKEDILLIPATLIHFLCGFKQKMDRKMTRYTPEQCHAIKECLQLLSKTVKQKLLSQSL